MLASKIKKLRFFIAYIVLYSFSQSRILACSYKNHLYFGHEIVREFQRTFYIVSKPLIIASSILFLVYLNYKDTSLSIKNPTKKLHSIEDLGWSTRDATCFPVRPYLFINDLATVFSFVISPIFFFIPNNIRLCNYTVLYISRQNSPRELRTFYTLEFSARFIRYLFNLIK